jgi:hypothetical protein
LAKAGEQAFEVATGEFPFERGRDLLVVAAEREQLLFERVEVGEWLGCRTLRCAMEK